MSLDLPKVPTDDESLPPEVQLRELREWCEQFRESVLKILTEHDSDMQRKGQPVVLPRVAKADLIANVKWRSGGEGEGRLVYCVDDTGGAVPAFGAGASWRRCQDRNVVS